MTSSQTAQRAALKAQADGLLEEALAKSAGLKRLEDIEALVFETGGRIGQVIEAEIIEEHGRVSGPGSA
ncbi:MAG: hypothetical protein ACYDEO_26090 [Aggregatilineales bacterium]